MDINVGDRFQSYRNLDYLVEIVDFNKNGIKIKVINNKIELDYVPIGSCHVYNDDTFVNGWKYLGNFSKSRNFNSLYNLLSDDSGL